MKGKTVMHSMRDREKKAHFPEEARRGFTLIELMVTVAIIAILMAVAAPSFISVLLGSKLGGYANNLVASAIAARSEAIKRNATVTLCTSADGTSCATTGDWEQGWIVMNGSTVIHRQQALPSGLKVIGRVPLTTTIIRSLSFPSTGIGATQATFTVCRASPSAGTQERVVTINASGRASASKTTTGVCS